MISIVTREYSRPPGRRFLASVSPLKSLMSSVRMTSTSVSSSVGNRLSKRKTTRVPQRASGEAKSLEGILRNNGKRWRSNKRKSSKCCENDSDLRTTAGIQVPIGEAEKRHTLRELAVVSENALDQLESKSLVEVLELVGIADAFLRQSGSTNMID